MASSTLYHQALHLTLLLNLHGHPEVVIKCHSGEQTVPSSKLCTVNTSRLSSADILPLILLYLEHNTQVDSRPDKKRCLFTSIRFLSESDRVEHAEQNSDTRTHCKSHFFSKSLPPHKGSATTEAPLRF